MDMARIATLAVEALVQAIGASEAGSDGTPVAATISKVPMQLVVRHSTATPPPNVQPPIVSEGEPQP
jgi:LacI family transcriptional regulator